MIIAFTDMAKELPQPVYFSTVGAGAEDQGTATYLRDCAAQAGVSNHRINIEDIGLSTTGTFSDLSDTVIGTLLKLYPLEQLFNEDYGQYLPRSGLHLIEPPWKAVLNNKGILPLLWERFHGHPNLLPAFF